MQELRAHSGKTGQRHRSGDAAGRGRRLLAAIAAVCTLAASAVQADECGTAQREVWSGPAGAGPVAEAWPLGPGDTMPWGNGTATLLDTEAGPVLEALLPEGSVNPGNPDAPEGGVGLRLRLPGPGFVEGCLVYELRFEDGFDFGRGGKLPGLAGGRDNTGCATRTDRGFSTRMMWGARGNAMFYAYFADRTTRCGTVMASGRAFFEPGRWHRYAQRVRLNRPGQADGVVEFWIDGVHIATLADLEIRADAAHRIDRVFVQTFFGGSSLDRASPRTQTLQMRGFSFRVP